MGCGKTLTANFYPRPPRGGRPPRNRCRRRVNRISIHALREEGDILHSAGVASLQIFLSTPSARRATVVVLRVVGCQFGFLSTPSARRATNLR